MLSYEMIEIVKEAVRNDKSKTADGVYLYLAEETGEVATAMAVERGLKNKTLKENSASECVDVIISAIGLFYKLGGTDEELIEIFGRKSKRWLKRTQK